MPAPQMSTPFTSSEIPMKNQIEMDPPFFIAPSPENNIQGHKNDPDDRGPEPRPLQRGNVAFGWNFGNAVDQTLELRVWFRFCNQADGNRDDHADETGPQRAVHVFRHVSCV